MAKRKRLTVPTPNAPQAPAEAPQMDIPRVDDIPVGKTPDRALRPAGLQRAPIADVAKDAAAHAALAQVTQELTAAKREGRMIQPLPLTDIQPNHLVRDRIVLDTEEMEALKTSLRARGQQTPIEVVSLPGGGYGLISGYRRLQALKELSEAHSDAPQTVLALIRQPDDASDAYTAMVEENEIRVGLSYFERASIVQAAVREGVFPTETAALQGLFASASRSKRSKIKSFLPVVAHLGGALTHPTALTERMGLALASRCETDPAFVERLKDRLRKADITDAAAEQALIAKALDGAADSAPVAATPPAEGGAKRGRTPGWTQTPRPGVTLEMVQGRLVISGPGVSESLALRISTLLQDGTLV